MSDWRITPLGDGSFKMSPFDEDGGDASIVLLWVVLFSLGLFSFDMETQVMWFVGYIVLISVVCGKSQLFGWLMAVAMFIYLVCR